MYILMTNYGEQPTSTNTAVVFLAINSAQSVNHSFFHEDTKGGNKLIEKGREIGKEDKVERKEGRGIGKEGKMGVEEVGRSEEGEAI